MIKIQVDSHSGGQRLDRWLRKSFPTASLSFLFGILRKKKVRVNGVVNKGAELIQSGDEICIYENMPDNGLAKSMAWSAPEFKLQKSLPTSIGFIQHTNHWLVINKPAGMASQPGSGVIEGESLIEWLWIWAEQEQLDFKPALVQRLDLETSGLLLVALSGDAVRGLNQKIRNHEVRKEYLALVKGHLNEKSGTIDIALDRTDSAQGAKMQTGQGKRSVTHYQVDSEIGPHSLVRIRLETGRMHQIRAHFAHLGHPLLGDGRYGDFALNRELRKETGLKRLFLHSTFLEWNWEGQTHSAECPLPYELQKVVRVLHGAE